MKNLAIAVLMSTVLVACGDSDPSLGGDTTGRQASTTSGSSSVQACDLLSDADILELTSWAVTTMEPGTTSGIFHNGCSWTLAGGNRASMGVPAEITIGMKEPNGREYFDMHFHSNRPDGPNIEADGAEPLPGVGDIAFIKVAAGLNGTAMAVSGDALVDITYSDFDSRNENEVATALLKRALKNLEGKLPPPP